MPATFASRTPVEGDFCTNIYLFEYEVVFTDSNLSQQVGMYSKYEYNILFTLAFSNRTPYSKQGMSINCCTGQALIVSR